MARHSTLGEIGWLALEDRDFFNALLRDPRAAIADAELTLDPNDMRRLMRMLATRSARITLDPVDWFRRYHSMRPGKRCREFLDMKLW